MGPKPKWSGKRFRRQNAPRPEHKTAPVKTCKVCNDAQSKYKCPICLIPYCSLPCYKTHKGTPCSKPESSHMEMSVPTPATDIERTCYVDEPSEILQVLQLETIASSNEIREAIKDEKLRKIIIDIDSSPNAENDLDKYMEVEAFRLFSEKMMLKDMSPMDNPKISPLGAHVSAVTRQDI